MVDQRSPSFDTSDSGEVQGGLHQLAQSNHTTFYSPNLHPVNNEDSQPLAPHQQTSYNMPAQSWQDTLPDQAAETPESRQGGLAPYQGWPNLDHQINLNQSQPQHPHNHVGLGIGYQDDKHAVTGQYQGYSSADYANMTLTQQTTQSQAQSSPMPAVPDDVRRTRSGLAIGQSASPQGKTTVTKSSKGKKTAKASKREKPTVPNLDQPLSELTKDFTEEIKDMEAWVNRPAEVRWREAEKRNGHVARPMNSFMLYRSAYAERTKRWCMHKNHQLVSSVSGESWPMETPEIRAKYDNLAKIERENHQNAHPGYKFSPSKSNSSKKRKTGNSEIEGSELSEEDGHDDDWSEKGSRGKRSRSARRTVKNAGESENDSPYVGLRTRPYPFGGGPLVSSYQATNSGGPVPSTMEPHGVYGQYYQTSVYPNMNNPYVEDVAMHRTDTPSSHQSGYPGLVGLPGAYHQDLYARGSSANSPAPLDEHLVDPTLLGSLNNFTSNPTSRHLGHGNVLSYQTLSATYETERGRGPSYGNLNPAYSLNSALSEQHNLATDSSQAPEYHDEMHGADQWPPKYDAGSEFEKWYEQDH